jgi:hypothetical protein
MYTYFAQENKLLKLILQKLKHTHTHTLGNEIVVAACCLPSSNSRKFSNPLLRVLHGDICNEGHSSSIGHLHFVLCLGHLLLVSR